MKLRYAVRRFWCVLLAVNMAWTPLVYAEPIATATADDSAKDVDLAYVPPGATAAVVAYPRKALMSPAVEMMPIEVLSAAGKKEFGVDPVDIEIMLLVVVPPGEVEPGFGAVLRLAGVYSLDDLKGPLVANTGLAEWNGKPYRKGLYPGAVSLLMPDDRTLMIGQEHVLRLMLADDARATEGPLRKLMGRTRIDGDVMAVAVMEPIRELLTAQLAEAPLPPPFNGLKNVHKLVDAVKLDVGITAPAKLCLTVLATDEEAAEQLERLLNAALDLGRQMALMQLAGQAQSDDPVERAAAQYTQRISGKLVEMLRPQRDGRKLKIEIDERGDSPAQVATVGILVALLLPAVQSARSAARRASSMNNMKQLGLAMHMYHDAYRHFPARAIFDNDGKPLLSWRVLMLPYLEEQALFEQFHLDEPWDSEHNRQLIEHMPAVFCSPAGQIEPGKTIYLAPVGDVLLFKGQNGTSMREIRDGTSNTIMLVEANDSEAVIWTKPDDWQYDANRPLAGLGSAQPQGFNVLLCDGSVHFLADSIDPAIFKGLLSIADGEATGRLPR